MKNNNEGTISKSIDFLFKIEKSTYLMAALLTMGFILRTLAGLRNKFSGDEMVHGVHAIGFISSKKLQIMDQSAVWFWLTDFFMKIFSVNVLGIRFASILFGSLSLIAIYLIGKEMFGKKAGIIASVIALVSPYQLSTIEAGMDTTMTFFVLLSIYFFTLSVKTAKTKYFFLSWIAIGIAVMAKPIALLFAATLFLCALYYDFKDKGKKPAKKLLKKYLLVIALLIVMFLPVLTFNYLLYKDKGILDLQFARFTRISVDTYASISSTIESFSLKTLLSEYAAGAGRSGLAEASSYLYKYEFSDSFIVLLFSLIGLFYSFKDRSKFIPIVIITFSLPFIFLAGTSLLPNHFLFASFYISLLAGLGIDRLSTKMKSQKYAKFLLVIIVLVIIAHSLMKISENKGNGLFGQKEAMSFAIDFKESEIKQGSLVIADSRIYRGRTVFMFWDRSYLEGTTFLEIARNANSIKGERKNTEVYYVECVPEDCGWGYIDEQPQLNQSMEALTLSFSSESVLVKTINDIYGRPYFKIYKANILLSSGVFDIAESNKEWSYYPVNYKPKSKIFDNYEIKNPLDKTLNMLARMVLHIEIFAALLLAFAVIYILIRDK